MLPTTHPRGRLAPPPRPARPGRSRSATFPARTTFTARVAFLALAALAAFVTLTAAPAVAKSKAKKPAATPAPLLTGARLGVTAERTRIVLEFSRGDFRHEQREATGTSLTLRLPNVQAAKSLQRQLAGKGRLADLVVSDGKPSGLDVRLAFRHPSRVSVFRVDAEGKLPHRLVIDLSPEPGGDAAQDRPAGTQATAEAERPAPPPPPLDLEPAPAPRKAHVVVIDAGHGGHDPGAVGKDLKEKEVCLDVALRLAERLNRLPGFEAHLTRSDDRLISLGQRLRFAESKDADLFVSIHVNAAPSRAAVGAEVFYLSIGAATDRASSELARLENEAHPDYVVAEDAELQGLPFAVSLRQSDTLLRSSRIAEVVLDVLAERKLGEPRGVKQAAFAVLKSFQVPSILVELGFISNPVDRKRLQTKEHRGKLAEALADGVRQYFERYAPQRGVETAPAGSAGAPGGAGARGR